LLALKDAYPEHNWNERALTPLHLYRKDGSKPSGYWDSIEHQKAFFDQLATKLNIQKPEEWVKVTTNTIIKEGGFHFLKRFYNGSKIQGNLYTLNYLTCSALRVLYPEHQQAWKDYKPSGYWRDIANQRAFLDQLARKLNVQKPEDWYNVMVKQVIQNGGSFVQYYYNGSLRKGTLFLSNYFLT
jgi:hypothetical protein